MVTGYPTPFISIVIPAKDEEQYIARCLNAVISQDYPKDKIEIIVVDNNSSDNTKKIAQQYENVKVLSINGTISAVRNLGGKESRGEFIAFLDSDCIPEQDWITKAISTLHNNPEAAVVGAILEIEDSEHAPWLEAYWLKYLNSKHRQGINFVSTISSFCFLVRKSVMEQVGWFNEKLETCEDSDLGYRIAQKNHKLIIDETIRTVHLRNAKTVTQFFNRQLWQGGSNLKNFFNHSFEWNEVPSVIIPFLYLILLLTCFVCLLSSSFLLALIPFTGLLLLPLLITIRSGVALNLNNILGYAFIWFLYLFGRGLGMVLKIKR